jgi:hypothetical protein
VVRFYRLVRLVIDLFILRGRADRSKDVEILVLRKQLEVLERQVARVRFEPDDRAVLAALARALGRDRWSIFLVRPERSCAGIDASSPDTGPVGAEIPSCGCRIFVRAG